MVEKVELTFEDMQKGAEADVAAYEKRCMEPTRCHNCGSRDLTRECDARASGIIVEGYDNGEWSAPDYIPEIWERIDNTYQYECNNCRTLWEPSFEIGALLIKREETLETDKDGLFIYPQ